MNTTKDFFDERYQKLSEELEIIAIEQTNVQLLNEQSILTVQKHLLQLREQVMKEGFETPEAEIWFFKLVKPKFYQLLIYYFKVLQLELKRPAGGKMAVMDYLEYEQAKLFYFYKKHSPFYEYYRSGADYLDDRYFLRSNASQIPDIETYGIDMDPVFTTGYDYVVAKMLANDKFRLYLEKEIAVLQMTGSDKETDQPVAALSWTASKAALIELIYGLQSTGVLNNGKAALSEIASFIENMFGIKLGNYYRVFQEIRIRKKSRTQFLDEMKDRLIQKMDWTDENPHVN